MRPFNFVRALDLDDALARLSEPGARALAGGTTLVDLMKLGVEAPETVVDINDLPLSGIEVRPGHLTIGALVSNADAAADPGIRRHAPAISESILSGASGQIRNAATMAGNLLQRTRCGYFRSTDWPCNKRSPGSGCPALTGVNGGHAVLGGSAACIAVNPSDLAVALVAADASLRLVGRSGARRMPVEDFYRLPEATPHIETALGDGELITEIVVPLTPLNASARYLKLRGRASYEFASASVAAAVTVEVNLVTDVAIAIGGLGVKPWRNREAEAELIGRPLDDAAIASFCDALLADADPRPATRYKLSLVRGAIKRVLQGRVR
jgi:xanthine dehydrogenase YagS FAD-binding subunit